LQKNAENRGKVLDQKFEYRTLEESLTILLERAKVSSLSLGEILSILSGKGRSLILILLSLPFCLPLQIPGLSTPFGLIICFIGLRMAFGKHIWLPKKILQKKISFKTLKKTADRTLSWIKKIRPWIYPRLDWACHHQVMQVINGLEIGLLGIFLALPLPVPFSNLVAAWSIFFIALGILEDDGLFVILGYVLSLLSLFILLMLIFFFGKALY
jgi:hypothetical protein